MILFHRKLTVCRRKWMFLCVLGENKEFYHIYSFDLPLSAAHICMHLVAPVYSHGQLYGLWAGWHQGLFESECFVPACICRSTHFQKHLNNCTFILLQMLLIHEPNQSAVAWYFPQREWLSCVLISLSLLSVHITTSSYSLLSSIFLHVTAARSLLLPDFYYTGLHYFRRTI